MNRSALVHSALKINKKSLYSAHLQSSTLCGLDLVYLTLEFHLLVWSMSNH